MLLLFSVSNFDVITHQKTEDLEYLCLKSKSWATSWNQMDVVE